jgi:hypothetical protein
VRFSALVVGQRVRARIGPKWWPGVVEAVCVEPLSYMVRLDDGRPFRLTRWVINFYRRLRCCVVTFSTESKSMLPLGVGGCFFQIRPVCPLVRLLPCQASYFQRLLLQFLLCRALKPFRTPCLIRWIGRLLQFVLLYVLTRCACCLVVQG